MTCCNEYQTCDENPKCMFKFGVYPTKEKEPVEPAWVDDMIWFGVCALAGGVVVAIGWVIRELLK